MNEDDNAAFAGKSTLRGTWLITLPKILLAALVAILVIFLTAAVFGRYVLDIGLAWSDEVARLLFVWIVFIGFAVAVRERTNIGVHYVVDRLPIRWRSGVLLFQDATILVFSIVFTWQSVVTLRYSTMQQMPALQISIMWLYLGVLIAAILMIIYATANLWTTVQNIRSRGSHSDSDVPQAAV